MNQFHALFDIAFALMERIEVAAAVRDRNLYGPMTHRRDLQTELEGHLHGLVSLASDYESELQKHNASLEHSYAALGPCDFGDRDPYALGSIEKLATELMSWLRQLIQMLGQRGLTSMRSKQAGFLLKLTKRCPFSEELAAKIDQRLWLEKSQLIRDHYQEKISPPSSGEQSASKLPGSYVDPDLFERDKWIYEKLCSGLSYQEILNPLEKKCVAKGWSILSARTSVREAEKRYCSSTGSSRAPKQKGGRPRLKPCKRTVR